MGHLVRITNRFVECGEGDEQLKSLMKLSMDEATQQRWDDFLSGPIADMNRKNETNLVSGMRRGGVGLGRHRGRRGWGLAVTKEVG